MPARRYLALYLPRWATDCLKRHDRQLAGPGLPLVLYERQSNAMRLVACDDEAMAKGLAPGQMLSDARAICPGLIAREIDRSFTEAAFADLADWHSNISPIVSVATDWQAYGDLVADITGASHLFGGEAAMLDMAVKRLAALGIAVQGVIAPTIGAAMALSHYAPGQVVEAEGLANALAALPVSGLRIGEAQTEGLRQMGLKTIGQLYRRDRAALGARFGAMLVTRLDQALGATAERLVPRLPVPAYHCGRTFAEPLALIEDVLLTAQDLAHRLTAQLEEAGLGAQTFHLMLYRADHKVMRLSVNAARITRDADHVIRLIANRIDRLRVEFDAGFGIEMIRLGASSTGPLDALQLGVFGAADGAADLDLLVDRLASRLGPQAVLRSKFINTHIPERAVVLEPAIARSADDAVAVTGISRARPLRLLPVPEEISVVAEVPDGPPARMVWRHQTYRFVKASGPERIGVEWWRPGAGALTRDYYSGEDETGRRFWLFREGLYERETVAARWFMHGLFA